MSWALILISLLVGIGDDHFVSGDIAWLEKVDGLNAPWTPYEWVSVDNDDDSDSVTKAGGRRL